MKLVSFKYNSSQKESCGILLENATILDLEIQPDFKILNTLNDKNKNQLIEEFSSINEKYYIIGRKRNWLNMSNGAF